MSGVLLKEITVNLNGNFVYVDMMVVSRDMVILGY